MLEGEPQSDDTEMGQTSPWSQTVCSAAVDMQENQEEKKSSTMCCTPAPPKSQLCSTPVYASLFEGGTEEEDSDTDQTVDYLDGSSDESVDWAVKATQNFNLSSGSREAHVEDTYMYTFPTEMV